MANPEASSKNAKRGVNVWRDIAAFSNGLDHIDMVFDVGANEGQTSTEISTFFPRARIHAFEPVRSTFEILVETMSGNDQVTCRNIGLSDESGTRSVFLQESSDLSSVEVNSDRGLGAVEITLETVSDYCSRCGIDRIDILKTDTEGHDLHVLMGGEEMIDKRKISFVYSEVGFHEINKRQTNFCRMLSYLQERDYQFLGLYEQGFLAHLDHPVEPLYGFANALFGSNEIIQNKFGDEYHKFINEVRGYKA